MTIDFTKPVDLKSPCLTREEMIQLLIEDDIKTIRKELFLNNTKYLIDVLLYGPGYDDMSFNDVYMEFNDRSWESENGEVKFKGGSK